MLHHRMLGIHPRHRTLPIPRSLRLGKTSNVLSFIYFALFLLFFRNPNKFGNIKQMIPMVVVVKVVAIVVGSAVVFVVVVVGSIVVVVVVVGSVVVVFVIVVVSDSDASEIKI